MIKRNLYPLSVGVCKFTQRLADKQNRRQKALLAISFWLWRVKC